MKLCFLLLGLLFIAEGSFAQKNPRNLDFESNGIAYNPVYPWIRSFFSKSQYRIIRDSTVSHSGRFSLRFTYDTVSKDISAGGVHNPIGLDVIGKKLRFSAYVKQSNPDETAGTVSCVISEDLGERKIAVRGFDVIHAKDWTYFYRDFDLDTFNLPVDHLRLNIISDSKDTLWVDDIKIEIDGKDVYSLPSFASARNEQIIPLSSQQISNLQMLSNVWGFLKYFHPSVAQGKFNWDMELFRIIPAVKQAQDNKAFNDILLSWIRSLGNIAACKDCDTKVPEGFITYNQDLKWMSDKMLNDDLRNALNYILVNRHKGKGYYAEYKSVGDYPSEYRIPGNLDFRHENAYGDWREIAYPNELFRLQFLFRYWNMIQYFYPYKNIIGKDWNTVLKEFIPRFAEAKDLLTYHYAMIELVNSINDSHSGFWDQLIRKDITPFFFPAKTTIINNEAIITGFQNDSLAEINGLQIGDVIEKIDDRSIRQIIDQRLPLINGSNYSVKLAYLCSNDYITGGKDSIVQLSIRRNKKHLSITARRYSYIPATAKKDTKRWKVLPDNIGYVNMGLLENTNIDSMFRELLNTRAIIFDLRHYPKSTVSGICNYLYARPTAFAKTIISNLHFPGTFIPNGNTVYGPGIMDSKEYSHYTGRVIILVNSNTQSQAEWTTMAFQAVPGAVTIGSQTSGTDGDVSTVYLTGDYRANMTGMGVFYPDGTPTQQVGVKIDIVVHPTVKGIRERKDEVLEKALDTLNKQ